MKNAIRKTFLELVAMPSLSGNEEKVRDYIENRLKKYTKNIHIDDAGNLIAFIEGNGKPVMLNAHMDRVEPGAGVTPIEEDGMFKTDGTTNLGADDVAGITIILEAVEQVTKEKNHPPLLLVFTTKEEQGLIGAKNLDFLHISKFKTTYGIVFDNAFEAGVVVSKGAAYISLDVKAQGVPVHPGKNITEGRSVLPIMNALKLPEGEFDNKKTRINWGKIISGQIRNAVPDILLIEGEIRTFLAGNELKKRIEKIADVFRNLKLDNDYLEDIKLTFNIDQKARSYIVDVENPWLKKYETVLKKNKRELEMKETFVASDANIFNERGIETFVISTGVVNEHTVNESIKLSDIETLVEDTIKLLI